MKKVISLALAILLAAVFAGCGGDPAQTEFTEKEKKEAPVITPAPAREPAAEETEETDVEKELRLVIDDAEVSVDWEDNESVGALIALASDGPLSVQMSMYGGFEQVGSLGTSLPRDDIRTTTQAGDIVLYAGDQIVLFYGSNTWSYTRLGRITDKSAPELAGLLSNGDVTLTLSWE